MRRLRLAGLLLAAGLLAAADEKPPADLELIYQGQAVGIVGRSVNGPAKEKVGVIIDVLIDDQGQPRAAVIDFGGFMGVGKRRIAVSWRALHFSPATQNNFIRIDLTVDQIKATPEYDPSAQPLDPPTTMAVPPPGLPAAGK